MTQTWSGDHFRRYFSFIVLAFFLTFMFVSGVLEETKKHHVQLGRFLIRFLTPYYKLTI